MFGGFYFGQERFGAADRFNGISVLVDGVSATSSVDSVSVATGHGVSFSVFGRLVITSKGTVAISVGTGVSVAADGVSATSSVGSVSVTGGANITPDGNSAALSVGDASVSGSAQITGEGSGAVASVGSVSISAAAQIPGSGSTATASVGSGNISGGCNLGAGGSGCTGDVGSLSVSGAANVTADGLEVVSSVGEVTVTTDGGTDVEFEVTGVGAIASVGSVTVTASVSGFFGTVIHTGRKLTGFNQGAPTNTHARVKLTNGNSAKASVGRVTVTTAENVSVKVGGVSARFITGKSGIEADAWIFPRGVSSRITMTTPRIKTVQNLEDDELLALSEALW